MPEFSQQTLDHIKNPRNVGEIAGATAMGEAGNPHTGNYLKMWIKTQKNRIRRITFKAYGCAPALAAGSAVTELAKGKTTEEAGKLTDRDVLNELGGLPPERAFCAKLAIETLRNALGKLT